MRCLGHGDMEGVHINFIALPDERLAVGLHVYSGESSDGAAGAVVAGNPLRKHQRHGAGFSWYIQLGMINVSRGIGEIHRQSDRLTEQARGRRNQCSQGEQNRKTRSKTWRMQRGLLLTLDCKLGDEKDEPTERTGGSQARW